MAPVIKRTGDLHIPEDLPHHRREWQVERFGWVAMALVVAAALAGLFGSGPLSHKIAGQRDSALWVEYERYARSQAPTAYVVHVRPGNATGGEVRVSLNSDLLERVDMQSIVPQPESVEARDGRLTYVFKVSGASPSATLIYRFKANSFGGSLSTMALEGGTPVTFSQFFYP